MDTSREIVVLGASVNTDRYSNMALRNLFEAGFTVYPVNPAHQSIEGKKAYPGLSDVPRPIHTVTVYVGPGRLADLMEDLISLHPERVILNPGAGSPEQAKKIRAAGIEVVEACTLVMLSTGQF